MATALDVITRAMRLIGALAEGEAPSAAQASDALVSLQGLLGEWETRGLRLGSVVDVTYATADTINVPITHINALTYGLAVSLVPEYGAQAAMQTLAPLAERSFDALLTQYTQPARVPLDPAFTQTITINSQGIRVDET